MSDQITITVSLAQAEAIVDAAVCSAVCAFGDLGDLFGNWVQKNQPDSVESDRRIRKTTALVLEVSTMLEPAIEEAYKRDPLHQQMLHALKMYYKHGPVLDE